MRTYLCAFILATSLMLVATKQPKGYMDTVYQWKYIDYLWESEAKRQMAIDSGVYDFSRILPMDVDKARDGRVFIAMLGMKGVPATLATVTDQKGPSGPLVKPYPDLSYFKKDDCDSITNVYRIKIDECNRLWVLDTGFLEGERIVCEAQLLAFDLYTDSLIKRIKIPNDVARNKDGETLLATPIVENEGLYCANTTVYMADPIGRGLIVWNGERIFRLENPVFNPVEEAKNITVGQWTMPLDGGIVAMDLSPKLFPGEERFLYFHALASFDVYFASTQVLKRSTHGESIKFLGAKNILSSQAVGVAFSSDSTFFMGMTKEAAIACFNKYRPLTKHNIEIVAQDDAGLQYINGMKVVKNKNGRQEELWALSNKFIGFQLGQLDASDYNFRILMSPVKRLVEGTVCELPKQTINALQQINKSDGLLIVTD